MVDKLIRAFDTARDAAEKHIAKHKRAKEAKTLFPGTSEADELARSYYTSFGKFGGDLLRNASDSMRWEVRNARDPEAAKERRATAVTYAQAARRLRNQVR
ncbi:MAG TPA: hypothetical protein VEW42_02375 [Candidatus Eisenbacteria bacterium]|nr:hypothetical protein [Candidatus Eisenbacteria bacterium]